MSQQLNSTSEINVRGINLRLSTSNRSLELCARMNYETENLDFIDDIDKNEVLFDLGACEGRFSIYSRLKGIKTYSFEPEKNNYRVLLKNLKLNSLESTGHTFNLALGEKERAGSMHVGQPWPGGHQKVVDHDDIRVDVSKFNFVEQQEIQIIDLDSFFQTNFVSFPNHLKIDIDGSELPFLKGAEKTLSDLRIRGLLFELDTEDVNFKSIVGSLEEKGFEVFDAYPIPNEKSLYNFWFKR